MFYLSRAEQAALFLLLTLLLAGGGLLIYVRGVQAGRGASSEPIISEPVRLQPGDSVSPARQNNDSGSQQVTAKAEQEAGNGRSGVSANKPRPSHAAPQTSRKMRISLSTATAEELDSLPGIGPVYARRIIEYRERKRKETGRGFESVDELLNVTGIGPKRLAALHDHVAP